MNAPGPGVVALPGVVVVGHGTADATGLEEVRRLTQLVAGRLPGAAVELGYLELAAPSIAVAVDRLAARGCRGIVAAPLLLFRAGHARRDVPAALAAAAAVHGLAVRQAEPLGAHPAIVALARRRWEEAVAGCGPSSGGTRLVFLGRGSSDPRAVCQLCRVALAAGAGRAEPVHLGFAAAASPTLDEAVGQAAAAADVRRVVVQPHLLFAGHVAGQVEAAVGRGRAARPGIAWLQVARLGPDPLVAEAVVARLLDAAPELRTALADA
jgi:sirohydrochlorin cobaltochelatase